jgi:signal transduction histidine kinase
VVVLAPWARDAAVVSGILRDAQLKSTVAADIAHLVLHMRSDVGAVLVTEEALTRAGLQGLVTALAEQSAWSDLPVLLLLADDNGDRGLAFSKQLAALTSARNVTVLQRPVPAITLVSLVQAALHARRRQYQVRDLIMRERTAREEAEAATRTKDEFLASVSHELRTPLSAILLWSQLLEDGRLTAEQTRHAARVIAFGAQAQSKLIEDLLDVSRLLTGKLRLEVQAQRLAPILSAALEVVRPMAEAKEVRVQVHIGSGSDMVLADAERLQQVFWNLLSNAVKFTAPTGQVSLELLPEPRHVTVRIADTGQGIDPEFLPHVFERFRQADPASTRRHGGLGIGLSIVQQLVELHGGTIVGASAGKDKGSSFSVRLPLASPALSLTPRAAPLQRPAARG